MGNMKLYNAVRAVPPEAKKEIKGGRLKGMTDINPMWRIRALTEHFGPAGIGWFTQELRREFVPGAGGEIAVFIEIALYIKAEDGKWSEAIYGTGGNLFVANERNGLHTNDEAVKMAYTDALGVACKALGFGADVYFEKDRTKYDGANDRAPAPPKQQEAPAAPTRNPDLYISPGQIKFMRSALTEIEIDALKQKYKLDSLKDMSRKTASTVIEKIQERRQTA